MGEKRKLYPTIEVSKYLPHKILTTYGRRVKVRFTVVHMKNTINNNKNRLFPVLLSNYCKATLPTPVLI